MIEYLDWLMNNFDNPVFPFLVVALLMIVAIVVPLGMKWWNELFASSKFRR